MKKILILLTVLMLALNACASPQPAEGCDVAVKIVDDVSNVAFAAQDATEVEKKLVSFFVNVLSQPASATSNSLLLVEMGNPPDEAWGISLDFATTSNRDIGYYHIYSGLLGAWKTDAGTYAENALLHVAVYYDYSSPTTAPRIYIDGSSVNVTAVFTPSGTRQSETGMNLSVGNPFTNAAIDGEAEIYDLRVYDLTAQSPSASEIDLLVSDIYQAKGADGPGDAVFWCPLNGAAGIQDDGATLGSTNYLYDQIQGAQGTPSGSPVFVADAYLSTP